MVKTLTENKFICEICHRIYPTADQARDCQDEHDTIYVQFQRADLKRLILFINTGELKLLTPSLMSTLEKYSRLSSEPEQKRDNYTPQFD